MLKHDRLMWAASARRWDRWSAVFLRTVDKSAQAISLQVKNDLGLPFDLSSYTIFGVSDSGMYLVPTCIVGGASLPCAAEILRSANRNVRLSCCSGGLMMVERILVVGPKDCLAMVDDLAPKGFEIIKAPSNSPEAISALHGAHYLVGFVQQMVSEQLYKAAPHLRLVQCLSAGYDQADLVAARRSKIPLCNNGGANSVAVSEHALLLMLSVSRRLIRQHANVTAGRWHGNAPPTVHELRSKVLGIVGLGTIGKKVARLAQAFGMTVHYYDIARLKEDQEDTLGVRFRLLPEILRHSDILSLHVPLNGSTRHLIGAGDSR